MTDDNDRRLLNSIIERFLSPDVLQEEFSFAQGTRQATLFQAPAPTGEALQLVARDCGLCIAQKQLKYWQCLSVRLTDIHCQH